MKYLFVSIVSTISVYLDSIISLQYLSSFSIILISQTSPLCANKVNALTSSYKVISPVHNVKANPYSSLFFVKELIPKLCNN